MFSRGERTTAGRDPLCYRARFSEFLAEENDASRADDGDRRAEKFFDDAAFAEEAPTEKNVQRRRELEQRQREPDVEPFEREVRRKLHRSDASGGRGKFERVADGKAESRRRLDGLR